MPSENKQVQSEWRARCIRRIHVAKRELCIDDEEYRFMLNELTGKDSCKKLSKWELAKVESHLRKMGFKPKFQRKDGKRLSPKTRHKEDNQKTMVDKIRALWIDLHRAGVVHDGSENALEHWVERMSARYNRGQGIQKLEWLGQNEFVCFRVLESLKKWHAREI